MLLRLLNIQIEPFNHGRQLLHVNDQVSSLN